jgi:hypothetical protein
MRRDNPLKGNPPYHQKWRHNEPKQEKGMSFKKLEDKCYMCGMHGHWSCTCRMPKHLTDLYQVSLKKNIVETNLLINMILKVIMLILMFLISLKTQIKQITYLVVESLGMINIFIFIRIFIILYFQQIMSILFQLNYKL